MLTQKTVLTRPASIAPGMTAMTRLSTTSIVRIETVSAARTRRRAAPNVSPERSSGKLERV
jgi:hypothetical protein